MKLLHFSHTEKHPNSPETTFIATTVTSVTARVIWENTVNAMSKLSVRGSTRSGINTMRKSLAKKDRRYACVLYSYHPREDNELPLEPDDVIEVLEGEDGGWCLGYLRGRIGLFPSNYVKFVSSNEVAAMKSRKALETLELSDAPGSKRSI
ncbi:hypothetical protein Bbelb_338480 [Branchiostoma belcheri]|nr:hypothetical protein Bbelb_338480 [Branchiostoma belcheri]